MTEKPDAGKPQDADRPSRAGQPSDPPATDPPATDPPASDPPANDPDLPRPEDILPSVLNELKRHARVLRRVAERAMEPKKLGDEDRENR